MALLPTLSMRDFVSEMERADAYAFYAVLLYTPINGLDERLHNYVKSRWMYLNRLTGNSCLVFAVEDIERGPSITDFKPEEVYDIARYLGASIQDLPCMILFTEPRRRNDTLILKPGELLPKGKDLTDEELTAFFRALQSIIDLCSSCKPEARLPCLRDRLQKKWPQGSQWTEIVSKVSVVGNWLITSVTTGSTVLGAISTILNTISAFCR